MKSLGIATIGVNAFRINMLKRLALTAISFIVSTFLFAPYANAQWTEIQQFPAADGYISASYFFNAQVGLIGFHWNVNSSNFGMVQRTTDGGQSWTKCTVPVLNNVAPIVTDIWFRDSLNGWLTFYNDANLGDALVWHSTDGGISWLAVTALIVDSGMHGPTCVRQTPNAVTITEGLGIGVWTSTDSGLTWTKSHAIEKSGIDFEDDNNGIITEYGEDESTTFLLTTDGGLTWNGAPGGIQHNGWGVYAIKHGRIFVAAPEDTTLEGGAFNSSPVLRSIDNGQFWTTQVAKLPMRTTGDVEGVNGVIYVQNSGATGDSIINPVHGLMRSVDSGKTWIGVGGPSQGDGSPYPITITRFSVTGCGDIVYASDGAGGLWKTIDGGDSNSVIPQCTFSDTDRVRSLVSVICDTGKKIYFLHNDTINPGGIEVESLSIIDTAGGLDTTGSVYLDSVPIPYWSIPTGDSVAFGLAWHPGAIMDSTGSDSVTIRVIYFITYFQPDWGLNPYDTIYVRVSLEGLSQPADFSVIPHTVTKDSLPLCNAVDTIINLINNGCDSLSITKAFLEKNNWTLTTTEGRTINPPVVLGPRDTLQMVVRATPTSAAILFDSLEVSMHYEGRDTSFGAGLRTSAKLNPLQPALTILATLNFDSLATCDSTTSPLLLANTGCDTITITQADLTDSHFELLDTNGNPLKLPLVIPTDSTRLVDIRFIPKTLTTSSTSLRLHYKYFGFDSSNVTMLTGSGAPSGSLIYQFAQPVNFGNVSICSYDTTSITFENTSCLPAFIDSVSVPAPFTLIDSSVNLGGQLIAPGGTLTLNLRYQPTQKAFETGTATFYYELNNGTTKADSSFMLSGTGISGTSAFATDPPLTPTLFVFPTITQCDSPDSVTFVIYNTGCDSLTVTGLPLDASLTGAIGDTENERLPASLGSGDSLRVTVDIAKLVTGSYMGNLHIQYTLANGTTVDSLVPVSSTITAGSGASTLTMTTPSILNFNSIQSCATPDTTILLNYQGCGTITVNVNIVGTGFVFAGGSSSSSLSLSPGQTVPVHVAYDSTTTGTLGSTVTIQSSGMLDTNFSAQVLGTVQPVDTEIFVLGLTNMPVSAGNTFNATLTPTIKVPASAGLQEVSGMFQYRQDNFAPGSPSSPGNTVTPGKIVDIGTPGHMIEYYPFQVTNPNGIQLVPGSPLVALQLETMISDSVGGVIQADSLQLNGGDAQFNNCVLTTNSPSGVNTSVTLQCGDSILIGVLNGQPILTSEQPHPNPVTEESGFQTTLNLIAAEDGVAEIMLYDALGEQITHDELSFASGGTVPYTFHLGDLPTGSYYYAVRFTSASAGSSTLRGTFLLLK
jgi:hypothetical protein